MLSSTTQLLWISVCLIALGCVAFVLHWRTGGAVLLIAGGVVLIAGRSRLRRDRRNR
jgi:hypothetical protein